MSYNGGDWGKCVPETETRAIAPRAVAVAGVSVAMVMVAVLRKALRQQRGCHRAGLGGVDDVGGLGICAASWAEGRRGGRDIHVKFDGVCGSAIACMRVRD
eukprot:5344543-Pleurochrysis_carterae.AAC.1